MLGLLGEDLGAGAYKAGVTVTQDHVTKYSNERGRLTPCCEKRQAWEILMNLLMHIEVIYILRRTKTMVMALKVVRFIIGIKHVSSRTWAKTFITLKARYL